MRRRVYVHIGLQKTGTSYLQGVLARSRDVVAAQGLDLVPQRRQAAFWLMLDVRDRLQPQDPPRAAQVLPRLPGLLQEAPGDRALISEESLAPATDAQIERLLAALTDREVHVVVTCRDLARQVPSVWQQGLQSGRRASLPDHLERMRTTRGTDDSTWWQSDLPGVLARWDRHVPPDRIHVVTVPPPGSAPALLLDRYCRVLGIDASTLDSEDPGRRNRGLGLEQAEVLRQLNHRVPRRLKRRDAFGKVVKRVLVAEVLGAPAGRPIRVPAEHAAWVREAAADSVERVAAGGYDVVGDLADLVPDPAAFAADDQRVGDAELAEEAIRALSELVARQLEAEVALRDQEELPAPAQMPTRTERWWRRGSSG